MGKWDKKRKRLGRINRNRGEEKSGGRKEVRKPDIFGSMARVVQVIDIQ